MSLKTILIKPASSMCSMSCDYCFYCDEAEKRTQKSMGLMSEETLKNIIRKMLLQASSDVCFAFQGGEPTLRGLSFFQKAVELEQMYNRNHVQVTNTLQTNGLWLTEDWCRFFHDHQFLIGISLDGTEETHNQCRRTKEGEATYGRILHSIRLLDTYQVDYNILTVVNAYTAPKIQEIYTDYKKNGWLFQQYIPCMDPLGEAPGSHPYSLTPEMYGEFLIRLFRLWHKDWKRGKAPYIRDFENYIGILMGYQPEACSQRGICSIQGVTEADGSVYPCDFYAVDSYYLGNINQNKIREFSENPTAEKFIAESRNISDVCRSCPYYHLCRGGCRRNRVFSDGSYRNYFCRSYQMFFEKTLHLMQEMAVYLRK